MNVFKSLGISAKAASCKDDLKDAKRIILPGVGSFDWAMRRLNESGMRPALDQRVLGEKIPVLGVCVGMQMMADKSEEGKLSGLGWIKGDVVRLASLPNSQGLTVPHMGWNKVYPKNESGIFEHIGVKRFYFLHSFAFVTENENDTLATTAYGCDFAAAVGVENIIGTQFHPEKSHSGGENLLKNFVRRCDAAL